MKQIYNLFNHTSISIRRYCLVSAMLVLQFVAIKSTAQNRSNKGKEFWVGYGLHQFMEPGQPNSQEMVLYLSAETAATVTVSYGPTYSKTYNIPANTVIATDLIQKSGTNDARLYSPPPGFGGTGGEGVFTNKAIHIVSNVPIVAYAHIYGSASSGATMLMPTDTWGYSYISCNSQQYYGNNCFSYMFVIAKENNTVIEITPSVPTRNGRTVGVPFTATLQKGEIYQVVGKLDPDNNSSKGFDLTGTTVKSIANSNGECYPVAVFSGSSRTSINCAGLGGSGDNALQQIFGYETWGKRYLTAPNAIDNDPTGKQNNIYRIVVKDPNTKVKVNGNLLTVKAGPSYYEYQSRTGDYIEADKPVLVAQYMTSAGNCTNNMQWGDPEQVYISPIEQAIKKVGFYRNNKEDIRVNYLTLIIPTGGLTSLRIDGANTFDHVYAHPNLAGYSIVVKRWGAIVGQSTASSDSAFVGTVYGMGPVESYAYNAGTLVNNLNAVGSIHNEYDNTKTTNDYTCTNTPVELSILMAYQPTKMVWKLSELAGFITPATDVTVMNPVSTGTIMVKGIPYYKYTLPGTYLFNTKGEYDIPVLTTHPSIENCNNTERVGYTISVKDMPDKKFSMDYSGCTLDTIYLRGDTLNVLNKQHRWYWEFPGNVKDSGQTVKKVLATLGTNAVKLTAISGEGCVADTTFGIGVVPKPVASFTSDVTALCAGGKVVFADNSTFGGTKPIGQWYYDFGNGNVLKDSTGTPRTDNFSTAGTTVVKHVVKVSEVCISDTVSISIAVNANPTAGFSLPAGCIAADGIVQFTGTPTVTDNSTFTTHAWDFGDPAATPANPNTAAVQSPAHTYGTAGNYTIKYSVTTNKGCTKDSVLKTVFKFKPKLAFAALTPVCENVTGPVKVDKGTVLNGVAGTGYYRGPGVDAAGNMNPATAGAGTHTIWYVFTTTDACADSISTTIIVHPKPAVGFTVADVCLGQPVTIFPQADPTLVSWYWDFGNKTNVTYTNGNRFTFNYTQDSTWKIALVTRSAQGCSSDTVKQPVTVHPLPVADFTLPVKVCMPEGTATFTNKSTIKGTQALTYDWNFGEANATSTIKDPTYHYNGYGPVNISLTATSTAGCANTATKAFNAFFAQPVAAFKVSPDTLCQGTDNVFTDQSTDPTANILGWTWNFGDGTTSTDRNPVKKYTQPGEYGVQLQVASASGCASAPFNSIVMVYLQPVIDAGPSFVVPQGTLVQFRPTANDSVHLQFRWEPAGDFPNPNVFAPQITAMKDGEYTMTAIGKHNCTATDKMTVKVLKPVQPPTAFSPNGDGINDTWVIKNLDDYPGATVEVFNRYGARVYRSQGYGTPWDGRSNGGILPVGTYYYVIKLKNGFPPLTGYVTILK